MRSGQVHHGSGKGQAKESATGPERGARGAFHANPMAAAGLSTKARLKAAIRRAARREKEKGQ